MTRSVCHRIALVLATAVVAACGGDPIDRITEDELRADLFALAGDETRGREGGTLDELSASAWLAEQARAIGLEPAGDNGTYFQFFPLERFRISPTSRVSLAGHSLRMGVDVVPDTSVVADISAAMFVPAVTSDEALARSSFAGRALVTRFVPEGEESGARSSMLRSFARGLRRAATAGGAVAIVVVLPEGYDDQWARVAFRFPRGSYGLDPDGTAEPQEAQQGMPILYVRESALGEMPMSGRLEASISAERFTYPSVNVVARVPGSDETLRDEYVLFSAHQDHDGERYPIDGDAIWNGADDNATTSVALLAIGRAFVASPGRRSALFIWHGAEERGLMGSRWYVKNPTVPEGSIVAVLNGDMIGRNDPDTAALLGAVKPHRNSESFVELALAANEEVSGFEVDSSWDDPEHPEGWYYRSDHLPYARAGIPALFFTTLLHDDYHTPFDNPDRIDIAKLARMTRWMYKTGRAVTQRDGAPPLDPDFELERCRDYTGSYCDPQ